MSRFYQGRFGHAHQQLTPAQEAARRAVETAQRVLDGQLDLYRSQIDAAGLAGNATMPVPPAALATDYQALVAAEAQSKAADAAASAPPPASTSAAVPSTA